MVAKRVMNSRKEETISVIVETEDRKKFETSAPSGKSKGKYEVNDFSNKGLTFSIDFVNVLGKKIADERIVFETFDDLNKVEKIVREYDKSSNLELVGGNSLYALECSLLKAMAHSYEVEPWKFLLRTNKINVPMPLGNAIGGGMHVKQDKKLDFQEMLFIPKTDKFFDASFLNLQAYKEAKRLLKEKDKKWKSKITDENALATTLDNESTLKLMAQIRDDLRDKFKMKLEIGMDAACSGFWNRIKYTYLNFSKEQPVKNLGKAEQLEYLDKLIKENKLFYVEDPFYGDDFESFAKLLSKNKQTLICGDDLICTNPDRLFEAIQKKSINSVIIKPNQVGSLLVAKEALDMARKYDIVPIISHRSGETNDNIIAHLAVGWNIPYIKTGITGEERLAKINELLRIERYC